MKKLLITLTAILALSTSAFANITLSGVIREKGIDFGKVTDNDFAFVGSAEAKYKSFRGGAEIQTDGKSDQFRVILLGGYTLTSTLFDIEIGSMWDAKNHPGKFDYDYGHVIPFVTLSKGIAKVTVQTDIESQLSNIEGRLEKTVNLSKNVGIVTAILGGYTDCNDELPKTLKEIKYTNAYYGGEIGVVLAKAFYVGGVVHYEGLRGKWTTGLKTGLTLQF